MTPEIITHLLINVGLAATLVIWFVWQNTKRERIDTEAKTELELFIRGTLLKIVEENSALLRENQIILSQCVNLIETIENNENSAH